MRDHVCPDPSPVFLSLRLASSRFNGHKTIITTQEALMCENSRFKWMARAKRMFTVCYCSSLGGGGHPGYRSLAMR